MTGRRCTSMSMAFLCFGYQANFTSEKEALREHMDLYIQFG